MEAEIWVTVVGLAVASFGLRLAGVIFVSRLPQSGPLARALDALPGCLMVSLIMVMMMKGASIEWFVGICVLFSAGITRNTTVSMFLGVGLIAVLRNFIGEL
jgi:uncharacterized membrane protein